MLVLLRVIYGKINNFFRVVIEIHKFKINTRIPRRRSTLFRKCKKRFELGALLSVFIDCATVVFFSIIWLTV